MEIDLNKRLNINALKLGEICADLYGDLFFSSVLEQNFFIIFTHDLFLFHLVGYPKFSKIPIECCRTLQTKPSRIFVLSELLLVGLI